MTTPPLVVQAMNDQPPPQKPQGSWFGRNWGKLLGCGCLTVVIGGVGFVALIYYVVIYSMKNSDAYAAAKVKMHKSPTVVSEIGEPFEPGWIFTGSISSGSNGGNANFYYSVTGPNGSGKVHIVAYKSGNAWTLTTLTVDPDKAGSTQIDVLKEVPDKE